MTKRTMTGLTMLALLFIAGSVSAEIAVIANPGVAVSSLDDAQLKRIFLGKETSFPSGGKVELSDQQEGSAVRDLFYDKAIGKNASQMKAYWSKLIFSGKGVPPTVVGGDADVKSWVAKTPGGLGYVDAGAADSSVKVLFTVK